MLVLGNTMIMSARERTREYAVLKTLGFTGKHLGWIIMGESLIISIIGGLLGLFLSYPVINMFAQFIPKGMFPIFILEPITVTIAVGAALLTGIAAAVFPIRKAVGTQIVEGFRFVG